MSGGGPWPRVISGVPSFGPPISELATFPVRSVRSAASRVTVGPAPGTASPIAPLSAYRSGGNGATTRTAAEARRRGHCECDEDRCQAARHAGSLAESGPSA